MKKELYFVGKLDTTLFVWVQRDGGTFSLMPERETALPTLTLRDDKGTLSRRIFFSEKLSLPTGVYSITMSPDAANTPLVFTVEAENGAYPFLLNGPGVWHADFLEKTFHFLPGTTELYIAVPPCDANLTLSTYRVQRPNLARLYRPDGSEEPISWLPDQAPWYEVDVPVNGRYGYWKMVSESQNQTRLTVWNGYAMFFEQPPVLLPYAYFTPVCDQKLDYRVRIIRGNHDDVVIDRLYHETAPVPFLPGDLRLEFNAGARYSTLSLPMPAGDRPTVKVAFETLLEIPDGWFFGDCHFHSAYEDACTTPPIITKAARCNGADFIFLADHGGKMIIDNGLYTHHEEGRFHAYPAQECMNKRCHMNFLNVPFDIDDKKKDEYHWLADAKAKNPEGNNYVPMLNHPDAGYRFDGAGPYFRSWWLATEHKEIPLVENISQYRTLFDFLNHDRPLTLLLSTDTHDGTSYRPASRGIYLYMGDDRSPNNAVDALKKGRVLATNSASVFMHYTVDGQLPGTHFDLSKESYDIEIALLMTGHQVKELAIVRNENPVATFKTEDCRKQHFRYTLTRDELLRYRYATCWLSVIGYGKELDPKRPQPYIAETRDIYAYSNPVYFDGVEPEY